MIKAAAGAALSPELLAWSRFGAAVHRVDDAMKVRGVASLGPGVAAAAFRDSGIPDAVVVVSDVDDSDDDDEETARVAPPRPAKRARGEHNQAHERVAAAAEEVAAAATRIADDTARTRAAIEDMKAMLAKQLKGALST